jgi:hypothetical protein
MNLIKKWLRKRSEKKILYEGMLAGVVPVVPGMSSDMKKEIMGKAGEAAGRMLLTSWFVCGLEKKFTCTMYNEGTDEWFSLEMKKIDTKNTGGLI